MNRGIEISDDVWLSLEKELTLSFWNRVIRSENDALKTTLLWLGISVLEGEKGGNKKIDSAFLYAVWFNKISKEIVGIPHNPFDCFGRTLLDKSDYWLVRYPELRVLLGP